MSPSDHDDERDAWLSAALHHAPDAQAAPPPALSDTILRQARGAARAPKAAPPARPRAAWATVWDWLARPPVAAGFASLMVATVVGLIWWERPIDETLAPPNVSSPAARVAPATASAAAPKAARRDADAPRPAPASSGRRRLAVTPEPLPTAPAAPTPFADRGTPAQAAPAGTERNAAAEARTDTGATASGAPARGAAKAVPFAVPQAAADQLRREDSTDARPAALAALLDSVAAQPQRWSWQRGESRRPMNPALQGWLRQLDGATDGRWRDAGGVAPASPADVVQLYRDGTPVATLQLSDDAVWLAPGSQASLPRSATRTLKQALDDATR